MRLTRGLGQLKLAAMKRLAAVGIVAGMTTATTVAAHAQEAPPMPELAPAMPAAPVAPAPYPSGPAEPYPTNPTPGFAPPSMTTTAHAPAPTFARKSRTTAYLLSGGGVLLPFASLPFGGVGGLAIMITPTAGEFYAAGGWTFSTGMKIRVGGAVVAALGGITLALSLCTDSTSGGTRNSIGCDDRVGRYLGLGALTAGLATIGVGAIWDVVDAGAAVDRANHRAANLAWHVAPLLAPQTATSTGLAGLAVAGSF